MTEPTASKTATSPRGPLPYLGKAIIIAGLLGSLGAYLFGVEVSALALEGRKLFFAFVVFTILSMTFVRAFRIVAFSLFLIAIFVYIGDVIAEISGGTGGGGATGISPEAGSEIFWGKGQCFTCHMVGGQGSAIRCPNLGDSDQGPEIGIRAAGRVPGLSAKEYLIQTIAYPDEYVVEGFSKGIMPRVWRPPIALTAEEVAAVIAYLQNLGGEVDISKDDLPPELIAAEATAPAPFTPPLGIEADPQRGSEYFHDLNGKAGCVKCHTAKIDGGHEIIYEAEAGLTLDGAPMAPEDLAGKLKALRESMEKQLPLLAYVKEEGDVPEKERTEIHKAIEEANFESVQGSGKGRPVRVRLVVPEEAETPPEGVPEGPGLLYYLNDSPLEGPGALRDGLGALRPEVAAAMRFKIYFQAQGEIAGDLRTKIQAACEAEKLDFTLLRTVGPDLTGVAARQPWEYLSESILNPSVAIASEFQQYLLEDTEGEQIVGVISKQTDEAVWIVELDESGNPREPLKIPREEIEALVAQPISAMPGNFKDELKIEQIYDIIRFLLRLK